MTDAEYSQLSVLDKTNYIFEMLHFDAKACKVMSVEELKITAPVVVVKIFEKIIGLQLDSQLTQATFESNAEVVLRTLQTKYGLSENIPPSLLVRGDLMVLEQTMDIFHKLATKSIHLLSRRSSYGGNTRLSKEDQQTTKRVFNISARFNTTFTSTCNINASTTTLKDTPLQSPPLWREQGEGQEVPPYCSPTSPVTEEWLSSRDREELRRLQEEEDKKQRKAEKQKLKKKQRQKQKSCKSRLRHTRQPSHPEDTNPDDSSTGTDGSSTWNGWKDDGQRRRKKGVPARDKQSPPPSKPKEVYCYDTYSGYRVNPRLHALLKRRNNPPFDTHPSETMPSQHTKSKPLGFCPDRSRPESAPAPKIHLDRTAYAGTARSLPCYSLLEPLDLLLTIEHSFKTKSGMRFPEAKDREVALQHTKVANQAFTHLLNLTHMSVKPHARVRVMRLNAQHQRKQNDIQNKEFSKHLEIQIAYMNERGDVLPNLLFSRHRTRQWPSMKVIERRLQAFYSRVKLQQHSLQGEGAEDSQDEGELGSYPPFRLEDVMRTSLKQPSPSILDAWDARYFFSPEESDGDDDEGSASVTSLQS